MKKLFAVIAFGIMSCTVAAQTNYSGTWNFKEKQSVSGPDYSNALPKQLIVAQNKDSLIVTTVSMGAGGEDMSHRQALPMNGKTISVKAGRKFDTHLSWSADKKTLTITTAISKADNADEVELTRVDAWTVSADGKELTFDRKSIETVSENWESKGIYSKQ